MTGPLIWLISAVWSTASALARGLASAGFPARKKLASRVISVGNIQAGGAGKTPLVAQIAREGAERGLLVCILCRGYGARWERSGGGTLAPDEKPRDPRECGDEAALLHELAPAAWIGVGADRAAQYEVIRQRLGRAPDLVVLDDGFQHHRLERALDIVAVTSLSRWQVPFRDWKGAAARAGLLVWTKGETEPALGRKPDVRVRYQLPPPGQRPFWLVTGLADGVGARRAIEAAGYRVEKHFPFPDHARYAEAAVRGILEGAARAGCQVALTGKDWMKWRELGVQATEVQVLEPELIFEQGRDLWERTLWGS